MVLDLLDKMLVFDPTKRVRRPSLPPAPTQPRSTHRSPPQGRARVRAQLSSAQLTPSRPRPCPLGRRRISVQQALEHPYLATLHDPAVEPVAPAPFVFDFEDEDLKEAQLRRAPALALACGGIRAGERGHPGGLLHGGSVRCWW